MLVSGDLRSSFLLLVVLSFPVIALVVRRKWRLAVAREEEIRRLLVFASQEAARAELEASAEYGAVSLSFSPSLLPPQPQSQCAVCYSPTTTRCSRCKAVRYCSGKCQIIHWRQGHKDQCHPPSTEYQNDEGSNFTHRVVQQEYFNNYETEGRGVVKPFKRPSEGPVFTNSSHSSEALGREDGSSKYQPLSDGTGRKSISEPSSASVESGSVPSDASSESLVDASVEIISSNCPERSVGDQCAGVASDRHETSTSINSVDSCTSFTGSSIGESQSGSTTSDTDIDVPDARSCDALSTAPTCFPKETLESSKGRNVDDGKFKLTGKGDENSSEAKTFLRFSFNLSANATPSISHASEVKPAATLEVEKPINGIALSEKNNDGPSKVKTMPSSSTGRQSHMTSDPLFDLHKLGPREVSSPLYSECCANTSSAGGNSINKNVLGDSCLPNLSSKRSEHVISSIRSTSHPPKSREVEPLCNGASDAHLSSDTGRRSLSSDKFAKVDNGACVLRYPPNVSNGLKTSVLKVVDQIRPSKLSKHYQGLFPYELFVKLYNWKKVELRPCGLTNCGNSCYANVVLQCLAFTPPLTAYLRQGFHSKACGKSEWCFTCEFEILVLKAKEGKSPLSPSGILSQLGKISSNLSNGKEEDAHEFLRYVIDTMQSVCLKEVGINASRPFEEETTLIGLTFGGYLRSKIRCMKCRGKSERHERMMDLTLEIEGDIGSLEEALQKFTGTELLDGENKYKCSRCKSYEKAKKKFTVLEAPNVLTIALKRFQSGKFGKLNKAIRFPEVLNLAPYMSGTRDKSPIYSLYGVVVHLDTMNAAFSGHYVCYVKNTQNKWFKIDDSTVKTVERERVLAQGAYMLLYARCSPRAPKSIRETVISRDARVKIPHEVKNPSSEPTSHPAWIPSDGPTCVDCLYMGDTRIRRIFDVDSSSDNSSLVSGSDECSCSTESTRDSTSTDDFSEYIFGDLGYGCNSPYGHASDPESLPSSLCSKHSFLGDLGSSPGVVRRCAGNANGAAEGDGGKGGVPCMYSDTNKPVRNLVSSSSCRETGSDRLGWDPRNMKSSASFRR